MITLCLHAIEHGFTWAGQPVPVGEPFIVRTHWPWAHLPTRDDRIELPSLAGGYLRVEHVEYRIAGAPEAIVHCGVWR